MEEINKSIINLEQQLEQSIKTLKKEYLLGIHNSQKHIKEINDIFDNGLKEFDIISPGEESASPFNPEVVIDYNEKREPTKVIRKGDWDETVGFLPHRKVMYEIELFDYDTSQISSDYEANYLSFITNLSNFEKFYNENLRCNKQTLRIEVRSNHIHAYYKPLDHTYFNNHIFKLQVDNYLNIMSFSNINNNPMSKHIYFCFNKTIFPDFVFTTGKKLSNIIIKADNNIINNSNDHINSMRSKDAEPSTLLNSKYFIPDNYGEVYQYFVKVRDMIHSQIIPFKKGMEITEKELETLKTDIESKDKEIDELKLDLQQKNNLLEKYKELVF
jgi:hypothetical protein